MPSLWVSNKLKAPPLHTSSSTKRIFFIHFFIVANWVKNSLRKVNTRDQSTVRFSNLSTIVILNKLLILWLGKLSCTLLDVWQHHWALCTRCQSWYLKISPAIAKCPLGAKSPPVENHWSRKKTVIYLVWMECFGLRPGTRDQEIST